MLCYELTGLVLIKGVNIIVSSTPFCILWFIFWIIHPSIFLAAYPLWGHGECWCLSQAVTGREVGYNLDGSPVHRRASFLNQYFHFEWNFYISGTDVWCSFSTSVMLSLQNQWDTLWYIYIYVYISIASNEKNTVIWKKSYFTQL